MELKRVVIVGSGNVAEALARALPASGVELCQLFARNPERGPRVAALGGTTWTDDPRRLAAADLYLVAVSDRAVGEVAASLPVPAGAVVAHTAGSVPLDALGRFAHRAVLYPLQTFTAGRAVDFARVPLFIEASDEATRGGRGALRTAPLDAGLPGRLAAPWRPPSGGRPRLQLRQRALHRR